MFTAIKLFFGKFFTKTSAIVVVAGLCATSIYAFYNHYQGLKHSIVDLERENYNLERNVATQIETLRAYDIEINKQITALEKLAKENQSIERESGKYLEILQRHDLTALAAAKPGLIEMRINAGTKDVYNEIEKDSRRIAGLHE